MKKDDHALNQNWKFTEMMMHLLKIYRQCFFSGRNISLIKESGWFDEHFYLEKNPDIKTAGVDPLKHFLFHGGFEGRNPSALFDSKTYLLQYPDVMQSGMNPLVHYLRYGKAEGRSIVAAAGIVSEKPSLFSNPLEEYFYTNQQNIIHKWTHYFEIYHHHFQRFRGKKCVILEIGVLNGGSLQMWKSYFGPQAHIYGIDIIPECKQLEEDQIEIFVGSQSDRDFLRDLKTRIPKIDILIDDGGHEMHQQIAVFEELADHINDDGIYLCEDTHTSFLEEYGGDLGKRGTFLGFSKALIDRLYAWRIQEWESLPGKFASNLGSLHFYDGVVVVEKKKRDKPRHEARGRHFHEALWKSDALTNAAFDLKIKLLGITFPDNLPIPFIIKYPEVIEHYFPGKYTSRYWPDDADTMIGFLRLTNIENCIKSIAEEHIDGDLIETGVWRGGACIFMRGLLKEMGETNRKVWVADSFEGLPEPNPEKYIHDLNDDLYTYDKLRVSLDEVKANFMKYGLLDNQVVFLKGWFKDTLPAASVDKLAVLRLDGDMYESTIDALYYLYPKLSVGGYCIIDDWGAIAACKKAVEHYRAVFEITETVQTIDWTGVFWKKEKQVQQIGRTEFEEKLIRAH